MGNKFESKVFCSRRHVDRRRVKNRRLFFKQKYLDHKPERRISMIVRRLFGDRRRMIPDALNTFWKVAP
jgi:hypothetical protein